MRGWDINFTKGEEPKMTREEAIKKLECRLSTSSREFISALEALGLIKFDETAKFDRDMLDTIDKCRVMFADHSDFVRELAQCGYEIVKKKPF